MRSDEPTIAVCGTMRAILVGVEEKAAGMKEGAHSKTDLDVVLLQEGD
ncbi:hypothetical protein [Ktedonobacter robiniae]|uniref:Uncharacterized protein n=1 Tax=Ktedonobacter robiniae TaxID=2778365 RepID=A0ABQ3UXX1_9CHLR|nr:hypothetical protein [Ktedonobacter robiniae]GHO57504.1 hypothetical protein KSB_59790 [Ktedonobacter robiniae]